MSSFVSIPCCVIAWIFTLLRMKAILRQGIRDAGVVALYIWGMLFFFAISFTFIIEEFIIFFDAHTFPSLSLLITNSAFLVSQHFGMTGIIIGMEIPTGKRIIQWIRLLLGAELIILLFTYIFFVSKVQTTSFFAARSLAEAIFIVLVSSFAILMCLILVITQLLHFPSRQFTLMRLRTALMVSCISVSALFLLTRVLTFGAYIVQSSVHPMIISLSYTLLVCTTILFFSILLNDRLYAQFLIMSKNLESWRTFQDLRYLMDRLIVLCPVIGLPPEKPDFFRFMLKPEYYLYRTMIIILDSRAMLADFFSDAVEPETPEILWDAKLRPEAVLIHQVLQSANPSNDFVDIVETYRCVSRDLFASRNSAA